MIVCPNRTSYVQDSPDGLRAGFSKNLAEDPRRRLASEEERRRRRTKAANFSSGGTAAALPRGRRRFKIAAGDARGDKTEVMRSFGAVASAEGDEDE
jgi:hypothetical protein